MSQPPVLSIKMVPAGVEMVVAALAKLPYEQTAGLIAEIRGQAEYQLQELAKPRVEAQPEPEPEPKPETAQETQTEGATE